MKKEIFRKYKDRYGDNLRSTTPSLLTKTKKKKNDWESDWWIKEQYNRNRPTHKHIQTKEQLDDILKKTRDNDKPLIFERNSDTGEIYQRNYMEYDKRRRVLSKKEKVSHPNHYGGKDNPFFVYLVGS